MKNEGGYAMVVTFYGGLFDRTSTHINTDAYAQTQTHTQTQIHTVVIQPKAHNYIHTADNPHSFRIIRGKAQTHWQSRATDPSLAGVNVTGCLVRMCV